MNYDSVNISYNVEGFKYQIPTWSMVGGLYVVWHYVHICMIM